MDTIRGRVRKFGDNIDTDTITPAATLHLPLDELKKHAFEPVAPEFYKTVEPGDVIVAGNNFGCGSSREHATEVVKELGIRYIVCESMARIYMRNCVALGLYPILARGASSLFNEGDAIEIDFELAKVRNPRTGKSAAFKPITGTPKEIMDGEGILPFLKKLIEESAPEQAKHSSV
jgi:3-isopropylmalate/(R)-2-methylmalate dehydratase small subunit